MKMTINFRISNCDFRLSEHEIIVADRKSKIENRNAQ